MKLKSHYSESYFRVILSFGILLLSLIIMATFSIQNFKPTEPESLSNQSVTPSFNTRLRFEKNIGQTDPQVDFLCRGKNHILYLTPNESVLHLLGDEENLNSVPLRMQIVGANPGSEATGIHPLKSRSNYFNGNDPDRWLTGIPHYDRVGYEGVYDGIDLIYYINNNELEFDFIVKPGIKPDVILLRFAGADKTTLNRDGDLVVRAGNHELIYRRPVAWQTFENEKHNVDVEFTLANNNIGFDLGEYDRNETLIIDPQLVYSTYLGGTETDIGYAIAVDAEGCAYVTGSTISTDFPTFNSFQSEKSPGMFNYLRDVFVTKFNPEGTEIVFSTYIGGNWDDDANGIALDGSNNVYLTGSTWSKDDPDTPEDEGFPLMSAYQDQIGDKNASDAFVTVLNNTGSTLLYSTYFGGDGEDQGTDIALSNDGYAYITGINFSWGFPIKNAYMSSKPSYYYDAFVAKLNPHTSGENSLVYSTYLGGNYDDWGYGIAVDREGCAYVTGSAKSTDFPTTPDPIQGERKLSSDVFVTKFSADGLSLVYSTYIGSDGSDEGKDIEVDTAGCAYVCGSASPDFPTTPGAYMTSGRSSFVCKLLPDGSGFVYSTLAPFSRKIAVDDTGQVYIASNYVVKVGDVFLADVYVAVLNPEGSDTVFTITFGGSESESANDIALDDDRSIYLVGSTSSTDLPVENAFQTSHAGKNDVFVSKFGKSKKKLVVEVLQDPLNHDALPIPNTLFDIYYIDLSNKSDPLNYIETQVTDEKGLLHLSPDYYSPGMPVFIRITAEKIPAVKKNHFNDAENMYQVYVDNLIIDNNGNIEAQLLETDPNDTTRTYLGHTSLGYNLVVSIEWLASVDYVTNLVGAFIHISNLLYDVTNGQAFIDYVTVYDNKRYWHDADIKIFANNQTWPQGTPKGIDSISSKGHIYLPPALYDDFLNISIERLYEADPVDPAVQINVTSIVHELGHYAFGFYDEYENARGASIETNINFGFMSKPDDFDDPRSTEMSDYTFGDPQFSDYMQTEHYYFLHTNCWDYFQSVFSKWYGEVRAFINTPLDLGISSDNIMEGPNKDINNPDFSVGEMMTYDINATLTTIPRRDYIIRAPVTGNPVPGTHVLLKKINPKKLLFHGVTTNSGRIKLFNAEAGDSIFVTSNENDEWSFCETVVESVTAKASNTAETIELKSISGRFSILSGITFDLSGNPAYQCKTDPIFNSSPAIRIFENDSLSEKQILTENAGTYSITLYNDDLSEGIVFFSAPDSLDETFFVMQNASVIDVNELGNIYYCASMQLELSVNHSESTAERISLLSSDFPPPQDGLPDSVLRVSDIISLNSFPAGSDFNAKLQMTYYADSFMATVPEAMLLYRWENGWSPLETSVNLVRNTISATVDGTGYYAAFLDLTRSLVISSQTGYVQLKNPSEVQLQPNFPNPFHTTTTISFELPEKSKVVLDIFDIHGRKVRTLVDRTMIAGAYDATWDGTNEAGNKLPAGVYFCVLRTGTMKLDRKIVLMK